MKILLALPTYSNGHRDNTFSVMEAYVPGVRITEFQSSLLTFGFNQAWATALNERKNGLTHFMMLHSDIIPDEGWLATMVKLQEEVGASVLSVVQPIKNEDGLTSTALETANKWKPRRLTMHEIWKKYPETWTDPKLLVNTGLWIADITQPWVEKIIFRITDDIIVHPDGGYEAVVEPEDWRFSRDVKAAGGSLWVTRKVKCSHMGLKRWRNDSVWGKYIKDPECGPQAP